MKTNFVIHLIKKTEELDEVLVCKIKAAKITNIQVLLDKKYPDDVYSHLKNPLINDGSIPNGPDITRILGMIINLFIKKKVKLKKYPKLNLKN